MNIMNNDVIKNDEIGIDNPVSGEINFLEENKIIPTENNNDAKNNQVENKEIDQHLLEEKNVEDFEESESSSNINTGQSEEMMTSVMVEESSTVEEKAVQTEINCDVPAAITVVQTYADQEMQTTNIEEVDEVTETIYDRETVGVGQDTIFILSSQIEQSDSESRTTSRSRSPTYRIRTPSRRERSRRRAEVPRGAFSEELPEEEQELINGDFEKITTETVSRKMSRTWRLVPKYKRLTLSEAAKQEADLYYSFVQETNPEKVVAAGPEDHSCQICIKNKATRIVMPCGHQCLCYDCAKSIAFTRTMVASVRQPKRCPLCMAAIAKIMRVI